MTIIICKVQSGMCNRLIPFITSYRLAMNLNLKYYLNWDDNCNDMDYKYIGKKTTYNDMFENIDNVNYIDYNDIEKLKLNSNILMINYMETDLNKYSKQDLLKYDVIFFNNYVHPIFTKEDDIIIPNYSNIDWILNKTLYLKDIQKYFQLLKPVKNIQNRIDEVLQKFPEDRNNIVGLHIRHWPTDWKKRNNHLIEGNAESRYKIIDDAINSNSDSKFYICSTNLKEINLLKKKYSNKIIYFENRFGEKEDDKFYTSSQIQSEGNIYKNLNGVVDLYLLSKCNLIIGDVASSYSLTSPLLNLNSTYKTIKSINY